MRSTFLSYHPLFSFLFSHHILQKFWGVCIQEMTQEEVLTALEKQWDDLLKRRYRNTIQLNERTQLVLPQTLARASQKNFPTPFIFQIATGDENLTLCTESSDSR